MKGKWEQFSFLGPLVEKQFEEVCVPAPSTAWLFFFWKAGNILLFSFPSNFVHF